MPRKKPFSNKQKKKQLFEKREKKRDEGSTLEPDHEGENTRPTISEAMFVTRVSNKHHGTSRRQRPEQDRYRLLFFKESAEDLMKRKQLSYQPLCPVTEAALETHLLDIQLQETVVIDIPKRPTWNYRLSKAELDRTEERYFQSYVEGICSKFTTEELSYFELNLETWRQLWRVLEMSDLFLLITDIRHPDLHFPPALYDHVTKELKKPIILVLNKIDLAPPGLVAAWKRYLQEKFPKLHIICFTSRPDSFVENHERDPSKPKLFRKKRNKKRVPPFGPEELFKACKNIVQDQVDLSSWQQKLDAQRAGLETEHVATVDMEPINTDCVESDTVQYMDGCLTIGCIGYPNVGKSTVMNSIIGKKVVSVSRTPGHTKHFQTIFLTPSVRLCDCPGLVFPSVVSKSLQILSGIYPIAQVRDIYSPVRFLADRINLRNILNLQHADEAIQQHYAKWSPFDICDAWATKRGFLTAKTGRPDVYRAANNILRMAVDGQLRLCLAPPGYTDARDHWQQHEDTTKLLKDIGQIVKVEVMYEESLSETSSEESSSSEEEDEKVVATTNPFALLGDD